MIIKQIINALDNYSYGMRPLLWLSLFAMCQPKRFSFINYGASGYGKSYCTIELAKKLNFYVPDAVDENDVGLSPVVVAPNDSTPIAFFQFLVNHSDKCIIIDDSIKLSKKHINFLKEALGETGMFEHTTTRDTYRQCFEFTGSMIINTNEHELDDAVMTRSYINKYYYDHELFTLKKFKAREYIRNNQWDKDIDVWSYLQDRIYKIIHNEIDLYELNDSELDKVYKTIDSVEYCFDKTFSLRDDKKYIYITRLFGTLLGSLDDNAIWNEIENIIKHYINSGVVDKSKEVIKVFDNYCNKYERKSMSITKLKELLEVKFVDHKIDNWIEEAITLKILSKNIGNSRLIEKCNTVQNKFNIKKLSK